MMTLERHICGIRVDGVSPAGAVEQVLTWARASESRTVCFANAHMIMEARDSAGFAAALRDSDLTVPDGMPLVWALRLLGIQQASRVYGPDFTLAVAAAAADAGLPIGLYGGTEQALERLVPALRRRYPDLRVVYACAPPFRALTGDERERDAAAIRRSGARIVLVGLGCPKQEQWMAAQRGRIPAVMLGVGAAFDFLSGAKPQAPRWMMRAGLEWFFRLATEPGRLGRRYLKHNPRFAGRLLVQLLRHRAG